MQTAQVAKQGRDNGARLEADKLRLAADNAALRDELQTAQLDAAMLQESLAQTQKELERKARIEKYGYDDQEIAEAAGAG